MAEVKVTKKAATKTQSKVKHIHVEGAGNGFTVTHHLEPNMSRRPGGGMMDTNDTPQPMVFSGKKANKQAADHVAGLMAQMGVMGGGDGGDATGQVAGPPATTTAAM